MKIGHGFFSIIFLFLLASCAGSKVEDNIGSSSELNADSYAKNRNSMGTVLLDVNWGRRWNCGKYENAQLISFAFDRMPLTRNSSDGNADLVIGTTSRIAVVPKFLNLALLIPPGEYALSNIKIKVATSVSSVYFIEANRSRLLREGKPYAGSFKVEAGETVYIGNFGLDCFQEPILWRYYTEGRDNFQKHLAQFKSSYPFLDLSSVQYRLFETSLIGRSYKLK